MEMTESMIAVQSICSETKTKKQVAYDIIKSQIISHQLKPGTMLIERKLCNQLNISRTPVREALQQLVAEGMVTNIPPKGCMVNEIRYEEIAKIYDVRTYLEGLGARLSAACITADQIARLRALVVRMERYLEELDFTNLFEVDNIFHAAILEYSKNDLLLNIYNTFLGAQVMRINHLNREQPDQLYELHRYHTFVIDALEAGDADKSEQMIREHIQNSKKRLLYKFMPNNL